MSRCLAYFLFFFVGLVLCGLWSLGLVFLFFLQFPAFGLQGFQAEKTQKHVNNGVFSNLVLVGKRVGGERGGEREGEPEGEAHLTQLNLS